MKRALIYSVLIWLTGLMFGPFVYYTILRLTDPVNGRHNTGFSFKYEFIISFPSLILFIISTWLVTFIPANQVVKKLILSFIGVALIVMSLYPFVPILHWTIAYSFIVVPSIWLYPLDSKTQMD